MADAAAPKDTLVALGLVSAILAGVAGLPRLFSPRESALVGNEAPDFRLAVVANGSDRNGVAETLSLHDLRGKAVVLDFWATWCGPCRAEAPIVDGIARRWRDRGVAVVGIGTDAPGEGDPGAYATRHGLSYPIVHDISGDTSHRYGIEGLPTLIVVSKLGRVVAVRSGITDDRELDRLVQQAL